MIYMYKQAVKHDTLNFYRRITKLTLTCNTTCENNLNFIKLQYVEFYIAKAYGPSTITFS